MADPDNLSFEQRLRMQRAWFGFPAAGAHRPFGLVARGGDLDPERLLVAYANGIFPWPHDFIPELLWFSPSPRTVIVPRAMHIGRSTGRAIRKLRFEVSFDTAFNQVIHACAKMKRRKVHGTWITRDMIAAYTRLHELGFAHSVETWHEGRLVGGVYGVSLGQAFFGESMFRTESEASKIALVALLKRLSAWDFSFLDCQTPSPIATTLGAAVWDMVKFQAALQQAMCSATRTTGWQRPRSVFTLDAPQNGQLEDCHQG